MALFSAVKAESPKERADSGSSMQRERGKVCFKYM